MRHMGYGCLATKPLSKKASTLIIMLILMLLLQSVNISFLGFEFVGQTKTKQIIPILMHILSLLKTVRAANS